MDGKNLATTRCAVNGPAQRRWPAHFFATPWQIVRVVECDAVPGKYLLICNVAGHYAAGMWTEFTVIK